MKVEKKRLNVNEKSFVTNFFGKKYKEFNTGI